MLKGFGKSLRLGLGTDAIALVDARRWKRAPVEVLAEASLGASGLDHLAVALRGMLADADVAGPCGQGALVGRLGQQ